MNPSVATKSVNARLAEELAIAEAQVVAAVRLLDEGATVPFIARYRKEATGSLDDGQLRTLEERLRYLRELDERRAAVLASIEEQGKLTDELRATLMAVDTKARVEDIYLPYKPKRRTKAQIAREAGLEPLADRLLSDPTLAPESAAAEFISDDVADAAAAWRGRGTFWSSGPPRTPSWSERFARSFGRTRRYRRLPGPPTSSRPLRPRNFGITSSFPSGYTPCRHTGCSRCYAAKRKRSFPSISTVARTARMRRWSRQPWTST